MRTKQLSINIEIWDYVLSTSQCASASCIAYLETIEVNSVVALHKRIRIFVYIHRSFVSMRSKPYVIMFAMWSMAYVDTPSDEPNERYASHNNLQMKYIPLHGERKTLINFSLHNISSQFFLFIFFFYFSFRHFIVSVWHEML